MNITTNSNFFKKSYFACKKTIIINVMQTVLTRPESESSPVSISVYDVTSYLLDRMEANLQKTLRRSSQ